MNSQADFLSCDWGTTNFRLRLIDRASLAIIKEHKSDQGIKTLYQQAKNAGQDQFNFFSEFISKQLEGTFKEHIDAPLVCTGMLSSTLGIKELPYARMPLRKSGADLFSEKVMLKNDKELLLVSGARSELGFMRGEEIQAIGLAEKLINDGVLVLPGTHSKHLTIAGDQFTEINNFMTGELFNILASHSILAASTSESTWNEKFEQPFMEGVTRGVSEGLSANLLTVRAKHMFEKQSNEDGYYYLSGLVIGDEIATLKNFPKHVYMAAGDATYPLYKLALESIITNENLTMFNNADLRKALFTGQRKMLEINGW